MASKGFTIPDYIKFLKLGLTEMTPASGRCPRVRAVYPSLVLTKNDILVMVTLLVIEPPSGAEGRAGDGGGSSRRVHYHGWQVASHPEEA